MDKPKEYEETYERIAFGETVEAWLKGPIGKHILEQKELTEKRILSQFRNVDPHDAKAIMLLQRALDAAETGPQWLIDAVTTARQYDQILTAEEDEVSV